MELRVDGDRTLRVYDRGGDGIPVLWLHGTPNLGEPPAPLFDAADRLGLRWLGYDRPGYGRSTAQPGRRVVDAAADLRAIADALALPRFAVMGHSGGAPHALAAGAVLGDRVAAVAATSGLAPFTAHDVDFDWFAGMAPGSRSSLEAAVAGRAEKERFESTPQPEGTDIGFVPSDWAALDGDWGWFDSVVGPAMDDGPAPLIDDDLAYVGEWGFDPSEVRVPVRLAHGADDRMVPASHTRWLAERIPQAELHILPEAGHVSVLVDDGEAALEWIVRVMREAPPRSA